MKDLFLVLLAVVVFVPFGRAITENAVEAEIAELAKSHSEQGRPEMVYDPTLNMVARAKALDMAEREYFSHVDPDGYGPNKAVELAGYVLPEWWGDELDNNFIESIAAGYGSGELAFEGWMNSPGHRRHLLAEEDFYRSQSRYGVGYAEVAGSAYTRYYVFLSAPPSAGGDADLEPYAEWLFGRFVPREIDLSSDADDRDGDGIRRLVEFVLDYDPRAREVMPSPVLNEAEGRLEWPVSVREDLGGVGVVVEASPDLSSWSDEGVEAAGDSYSIDVVERAGFLRLLATPP